MYFFQLFEDTCYTILNKAKPKPKAEPPPPPKEEEKKEEGTGDSTSEEKMDQEGENVEKPNEHQNQEGGEETKPDADMEIDQLFLNNGLRALYLCSDKLFF